MSANTFTLEAAAAANIQVVGSDKGSQAVHDLIVAYQANRQKGTGNARHGDKRAPIFVGGGVVFGPRPCDYSKKVNKSTRRLALRRVLGDLIAASKVSTVSEFSVADGKTKSFIKAVKDLTDAKKVLIVAASFDETTYRAARNVQEVLLMTAAEVNIEQLMNADAVILVDNALETLASRTA